MNDGELDETAMIVSKSSNDCELDDDLTDDYTGKKVYVSIPKVLKRAAKAMVAQSDRWPRIFVRELKRMDDGMPTLMTELLSHPESYNELAGHISTNENKSAKKLVKSMNQHYLDYLTELGMNESLTEPMSSRLKPAPEPSPESMGEALPGQSMPGMAGPSMAGPSASMGATSGMPPMDGGGTGGMGGGEFGGGGTSMAGGPAAPVGGPGVPEGNKEFGYHHLIKEMGGYDNMKNAMTEYLDT